MEEEQLSLGEKSPEESSEEKPEEFLPGCPTREDAVAAIESGKAATERVSLLDRQLQDQHRIIDRVLETRPAAGGDMREPSAPEIPDFGDPVEDRAGFNERLGKWAAETHRKVAESGAAQRAQAAEQQIETQLLSEFTTEHSDYAGREEFVRIIARDEAELRGIQRLAPLSAYQRDDFKRAVKERCDKLGGATAATAEEDASRTAGVSAGSRGKRPPAARIPEKPPPSLADELSKIQHESGYD